ncbi:envelope protein UL20 [Spheniscid alphaherpesvirus 1]|uniref:Envelope protein UL20 n=1 Tax=Spheniscid alphaherpesvirus 1 TaxID=2560777 RepID=A0A1R3T7W3_9ALPH|nr:envelope protein UL20 [Spheniscid alphaherpesvirus 1]
MHRHASYDEEGFSPILLDDQGTAQNDSNISDSDDGLTEYIALSSYGGDVDFFASSAYADVPKLRNPVFTRDVMIFLISAFIVKPTCCVIFLIDYRLSGTTTVFLATGLSVLLVHYLLLVLEASFIYNNIRLDRLPLSKVQRFLVGLLTIGCPTVFTTVTYRALFISDEFSARVLTTDGGNPYAYATTTSVFGYGANILNTRVTSCLLIVAVVIFAVSSICDAIKFILPRVWARAVLRTDISF